MSPCVFADYILQIQYGPQKMPSELPLLVKASNNNIFFHKEFEDKSRKRTREDETVERALHMTRLEENFRKRLKLRDSQIRKNHLTYLGYIGLNMVGENEHTKKWTERQMDKHDGPILFFCLNTNMQK